MWYFFVRVSFFKSGLAKTVTHSNSKFSNSDTAKVLVRKFLVVDIVSYGFDVRIYKAGSGK